MADLNKIRRTFYLNVKEKESCQNNLRKMGVTVAAPAAAAPAGGAAAPAGEEKSEFSLFSFSRW